jgi:hypothetical protein
MTRAEADRGDDRAARRAAEARAERAEAALAAVCDVLSAHGCDCECGCDCDGHGDDCDPCLGCRIEAAIKAGECALPTPTVHVPDGETGPGLRGGQ